MDVDVNQIASSSSEAEEHLLSSLPSPKQVTVVIVSYLLSVPTNHKGWDCKIVLIRENFLPLYYYFHILNINHVSRLLCHVCICVNPLNLRTSLIYRHIR